MLSFAWPWVFWSLPLPWLLRLLPGAVAAVGGAALRLPFAGELRSFSSRGGRRKLAWWRRLALLLGWLLLVGAAARPQWIGDPVELPLKGRDLMLAVDLSGSMQVEDFELEGHLVDRLRATRQVAGAFIERRVGDRLGLILFGRQAYLQSPLTFDRNTVRTFLDESVVGLAGQETAIGNAIGLAVKRLRGAAVQDKILILLTDGANTAGEVEPLKAAELAAGEGLKIYTIGIGADELVVRSFFGSRRVNPSADLDEKSLRAIAESTGGRYFRARDTAELEQIYRLIDQLEPVEKDKRVYRPIRELLCYPLGAALGLAGLLLLVDAARRRSWT